MTATWVCETCFCFGQNSQLASRILFCPNVSDEHVKNTFEHCKET